MLQYYGNCGETETEYQKLGYILDTEAAYIIVDPEFPFMDLPYLHTGKPGQPRKQKFSKKGFKGFKEYRDQEEEDEEESTVEFVQPEISYDRYITELQTKLSEDFPTRDYSWLKVPWVNACLAWCLPCESARRPFQTGEGPSRGLLRDYEIFKLKEKV